VTDEAKMIFFVTTPMLFDFCRSYNSKTAAKTKRYAMRTRVQTKLSMSILKKLKLVVSPKRNKENMTITISKIRSRIFRSEISK